MDPIRHEVPLTAVAMQPHKVYIWPVKFRKRYVYFLYLIIEIYQGLLSRPHPCRAAWGDLWDEDWTVFSYSTSDITDAFVQKL